jgi:Hemerythrin HHE cation binding domain
MIASLPATTREQEARLLQHVDAIPAIADAIGVVETAQLRTRIDELWTFTAEVLGPHMDATERVLYGELERLLQNRHSMTPMRREHAEIRDLIGQLGRRRADLDAGRFGMGDAVALRRILFRLYGLLKVHLAEERLYVGVIQHGLSPDAEAALAAALEHPEVSAS